MDHTIFHPVLTTVALERRRASQGCVPLMNTSQYAVTITGGIPQGAIAIYTCNLGHIYHSGNLTRICTNNSWSGIAPNCVVDCGPPIQIMNGSYTLSQGTTLHSTATYQCQAGFQLANGNSNLTCGSSSQWIGTQPECEIIECGQPSDVKNGSYNLSSGTHYGSIGTSTCVAGYEIHGTANIMCDINGDWNGSFPDCTPVDCGSAQNIENENVTSTGTTFGHTATYNCVSGFELVGPNLLTCNASSEWEPYEPNCVADCGPPTQIMNGSYTLSQGTTLSSTSTYQCQAGFQLANWNSTLICDENSQWIGSQPECEIIECGQPPNVKNGSFSLSSGTQYGSIATASCVEGYEIHETANIMCGDNGNWNGSLSDCAPVDCGSAQNILNGHVASTGTTFGYTATYYCITGFVLAGPNLVKCNASAEWEPYVPSCQAFS